MKCSLRSIASTAGLLLLAGSPAWATPSATPDVQWSYNFTPNSPFVGSSGTGTVTFTNEPTKGATNSSDIVVTNLRDSSTASSDHPDTITNGAWKVGLQLTDTATGLSKTMMFTGTLGGSFSSGNSNVTDTFTGQTTQTWTATGKNSAGQTVTNTYTVSLTGYTPPGPPSAANAGSISAHVNVTTNTTGGGGGVIGGGSAPEPSTLVLSCLGLAFAGASSWRKRRALVSA